MEIQIDVLKAMLLFAAKDEITRTYLNAVYLETGPKGARLTATDGHVLACYQLDEGAHDVLEAVIPRELIERALKVSPKHLTHLSLSIQDGQARLGELTSPLVNNWYPQYRKVIPKSVNGAPGQYDPELLVRFSEAVKILNGEYTTLAYNGPESAAWVSINIPQFFGVIMPIRNPETPTLPTWLAE